MQMLSFAAIPWPPELDMQLTSFFGSPSCEMRFIYRKAYKMQLRRLRQAKTKDFSFFWTHARGFQIHPEDFTAVHIHVYAKIKLRWQKPTSFIQKRTDTTVNHHNVPEGRSLMCSRGYSQ